MKTVENPSEIMDLISGKNSYEIGPVTGKKLIVHSKFHLKRAMSVYLSPQFRSKCGESTSATLVKIHKLNKQRFGTCIFLKKFFSSIESDMEKLCLTEHQIISFLNLQPQFLEDENGRTLFLTKGEKDFVVACAEPKFHWGGPIKMEPIDILETIFVEDYNVYIVIPDHTV